MKNQRNGLAAKTKCPPKASLFINLLLAQQTYSLTHFDADASSPYKKISLTNFLPGNELFPVTC